VTRSPLLLGVLECALLDDTAGEGPFDAFNDCVLVVVERAVEFGERADSEIDRARTEYPAVIESIADIANDRVAVIWVGDFDFSSAVSFGRSFVVVAKIAHHGFQARSKAFPVVLVLSLAPALAVG